MGLKYSDLGYAAERVSGTVVRHKDKPVYVEFFDGKNVRVRVMGSDRFKDIPYDELDLTPVPLGNVNLPDGVVYTCRMPKRRDWRQGLRANTFAVSRVTAREGGMLGVTSKWLVNTIMGIFPSLRTCVESVEVGETEGMAFSRLFSIGRREEQGYALYHREEVVGHISVAPDGTLNPILQEDYEYLRELLQEDLKNG